MPSLSKTSTSASDMEFQMQWNILAAAHYDWVERMGWHNKSVLEALALIGSEIGETFAEAFTQPLPEAFGEELADIVLRTVDLAHWQGTDLTPCNALATALTWRGQDVMSDLGELMVIHARWVNTARALVLGHDFAEQLQLFLARVAGLALRHGVNLGFHIERKRAINEQRGTRGRRI